MKIPSNEEKAKEPDRIKELRKKYPPYENLDLDTIEKLEVIRKMLAKIKD